MRSKDLLERVIARLKDEGAIGIVLFGSYARDEGMPGSDFDIIVEFTETKSLLNLVRIERELSEDIGINVDLLTEGSISPYLIDSIMKESVIILG